MPRIQYGNVLFRKNRAIWWTPAVVLLAALVILVLWKVPEWQVRHVEGLSSKERFDRVNEARKTLATVLGGLVVLGGAYFTWRNIKLLQEGQITDRFTKAIEQLGAVDASGKKKLEVRLGGIYALERIANQSERDHWPVMEVLCTYVRENAPALPERGNPQDNQGVEPPSEEVRHPVADIQAILTVLGRRNRKYEQQGQHLDLSESDLGGANLFMADLSGASLFKANLSGANLSEANLSGAELDTADLSSAKLGEAYLREANLSEANLSGAELDRADLLWANLSGAYLDGADLSEAYLREANLSRANLSFANLSGTNLSGANLSGASLRYARNLTQKQIDTATGNIATKLPENLHEPDEWKKG